jgi:hypothetical protein
MVILVVLAVVVVALFVVGHRLVAAGSNTQVANGVVLLVAVAALASWVLSGLTFDAGF